MIMETYCFNYAIILTSYNQSYTYENYYNFQCVHNHDHVLATEESRKLSLLFCKHKSALILIVGIDTFVFDY